MRHRRRLDLDISERDIAKCALHVYRSGVREKKFTLTAIDTRARSDGVRLHYGAVSVAWRRWWAAGTCLLGVSNSGICYWA